MTDRELIKGLSEHDRTAINFLVNTYQQKVIKTAYYFIGNIEDAEDLSQEIFLEIIKSIKGFRGASSLSTWIYRIIVNRSINVVKRNRRREIFGSIEKLFHVTADISNMVINEPTEDLSPLEESETKEILDRAVNALSENQRVAFVLNKYEELSYKEIAEIMHLSVSAVESLIHRAKNNLQRKLVNHFSQISLN